MGMASSQVNYTATTHRTVTESSVSENSRDDLSEKSLDAQDWLVMVGGVSMTSCSTRKQLLSVALRAPDDYTFGLVFGKITDILALKKQSPCAAYPVVFETGALDDLERGLQNEVFDRAILLERDAQAADGRAYESMTYLYSQEKTRTLKHQLKTAKHPFLKGQLTSWLNTNKIAAKTNCVYLVS